MYLIVKGNRNRKLRKISCHECGSEFICDMENKAEVAPDGTVVCPVCGETLTATNGMLWIKEIPKDAIEIKVGTVNAKKRVTPAQAEKEG